MSRAVRIATSFASAPANVKKLFDIPAGVTSANFWAARARTSVAMNGDTKATLAIWVATASVTLWSPWPMFAFIAIELKSRRRSPATVYR